MKCVFCDIVKGKVPNYKICENNEFLAILDIYPNTKGQTLVLTKRHYPSYIFKMDNRLYYKFLKFTKEVAKLLDRKLKVKRTTIVMEGLGVNHAHIKLYPLHGLKKDFEEVWSKKKVFFKKYKGYITTQLGPKANGAELKRVVKRIRE